MGKKNISQEKIIQAFLACSFQKSAGATSLSDISEALDIKKASLYNHFESRDSMYESTISFCAQELQKVSFITDKTIESIKKTNPQIQSLFKKLIIRYFNMFETEPLFQVYAFVHTEQYFNKKVLDIVREENESLINEIKLILQSYSEIHTEKIIFDKNIKEIALSIGSVILQQRDFYIICRKDTIRNNPECGVGSLFALPSDDKLINHTAKLIEVLLSFIKK